MVNFLTQHWIQTLSSFNTLWVGYSGGLDSTALLAILLQESSLKNKIRAIHINHHLQMDADAWEVHCQQPCTQWGIPLLICDIKLDTNSNIEEQARILRYQQFESHIGSHDGLVLAHHQDDQAETVLLQLFRGAGIDGLAAMPEIRSFSHGMLLRPLLNCSRQVLLAYAKFHHLSWIEDFSNTDEHYSRNYIRQKVLPLIEQRWPEVKAVIARTANHCQQARVHLTALALHDARVESLGAPQLILDFIKDLPYTRLTNVLRAWLKEQTGRMVNTHQLNALINSVVNASKDTQPKMVGSGYQICRYKNTLYYLKNSCETPSLENITISWSQFPEITEILPGLSIQAIPALEGFHYPEGQKITIHFRKGGETIFFRKQRKCLKKILQNLQIPPWERTTIPLLYIGDELAVVVGYIVSDLFYLSGSTACYQFVLKGEAWHNH